MRPKTRDLHELSYTEIVKSGTCRHASVDVLVQALHKSTQSPHNLYFFVYFDKYMLSVASSHIKKKKIQFYPAFLHFGPKRTAVLKFLFKKNHLELESIGTKLTFHNSATS